MGEPNAPDRYLGVEAAAAYLGVSRTKVWRLIKDGVLTTRTDVLDRRKKLIAIDDLNRLKAGRVAELGPSDRR